MITNELPELTHFQFDGIAEVVAKAQTPYTAEKLAVIEKHRLGNPRSKQPCPSWDCNLGWEGALNLARDGWHLDGKATATLLANPHGKIEFGEAGDEVDVGSFLAGEPECFIQRVGEVATRQEHIVVMTNYPGNTDASAVYANGQRFWKLCLDLFTQGVDVAITGVRLNTDGDEKDRAKMHHTEVYSYPLRQHGDPIESQQFMAAIHPAFYRRLLFSVKVLHGHPTPSQGWTMKHLSDKVHFLKAAGFSGARFIAIRDLNQDTRLEDLPVI